MNETAIERTKIVKYLGLHIDKCLTWGPHIENLSLELSKPVGIIYKVDLIVRKNSKIYDLAPMLPNEILQKRGRTETVVEHASINKDVVHLIVLPHDHYHCYHYYHDLIVKH